METKFKAGDIVKGNKGAGTIDNYYFVIGIGLGSRDGDYSLYHVQTGNTYFSSSAYLDKNYQKVV